MSNPDAKATTTDLALADPWQVQAWNYPSEGSPSEQLTFLLNYAVLAPSSHNTQPWTFKIVGDEVELYADRLRALPVVDPDDRELIMSCGAALFHLRVAMRHFGRTPVVHTFPDLDDPDLLAFIRLGPAMEPTAEDERLFMAIRQRHTNRQVFEDRLIPQADKDTLVEAAQQEGARLHLFEAEAQKDELATLIARGDRIQASDSSFRRELAAWIHPNRSKSRDGIPGYAQGMGDLESLAGPFVVRTFDWGSGQAAKDRQLAEGSALMAVLTTEDDKVTDWLRAGQALDRVLLTAESQDIHASFLNQPIELPSLRDEVAGMVDAGIPQILLRFGYGPPSRPTPRRPVHDVLSTSRYL
jgi:nitroreductase